MTALFLSAVIAIGSAVLIAYRLGRWHGLELGLGLRFADETAGDWTDPYLGLTARDVEGLHSSANRPGAQRHHGA